MPKKNKRPIPSNAQHSKRVLYSETASTDNERIVWDFGAVDKNGYFRFDPKRNDFDSDDVFERLIALGELTWGELKSATHDEGKSAHHFLSGNGFSKEAKQRIQKLNLKGVTDSIFSLRISNKVRIIGIRKGERFIVKWYDPKHEFYPTQY